MSLVEAVAHNLATHRRRRNLSQHALASMARISVSYVSMLERGLRSPPLETLERLANALGVSPLTLIDHGHQHRPGVSARSPSARYKAAV